jgi:hypothetical protein
MPKSNLKRIRQAFDQAALRRICLMPEADFAAAFGMEVVPVDQPHHDYYNFRDNGSKVLAVAHLDNVVDPELIQCNFLNTAGGPVVYSPALDDRLGAYIILDLLPKLGITYDVLLTTGEEWGQSTAAFFEPPKEYDWIIEFDRGGMDVVMYQYDDDETRDLVRDAGARVGEGSFSDIAYLEHLGVKAFNWGVGYQDYHSVRSHAYLDDTFTMVEHYLSFHENNDGIRLPHTKTVKVASRSTTEGWESWTDKDWDKWEDRVTG